MTNNNRVDFANTLRGVAAISVLIGHYLGVFWLRRQAVADLIYAPTLPTSTHPTPSLISLANLAFIPTALPEALYAFNFDFGAYGVALFFLISGFVIPFSLKRTNWISFSMNRFFRILPTYIVGFTITLVALWVATQYFSTKWPHSLQEVLIHYLPGIRDLLGSKNIDGIIWTLEIEIKFYFICAAFIIWFRQQSIKVFFIPIALFLIALYAYKMNPLWANIPMIAYQISLISLYIIFMFIGVAFYYLYQRKITRKNAFILIAILFTLFCIHWKTGPWAVMFTLSWSYFLALLTFTIAYNFQNLFRANRFFDFLANISYPLYVIHGVGGYIALRILLDHGVGAWTSLLIVTPVVLIISWLLHKFIEQPSHRFGKKIISNLGLNK